MGVAVMRGIFLYDEEDEEECLEIRKNAEILEDGQTDCSHNDQSSVSLKMSR